MIEAQYRDSGVGQAAREQDELTMASGPVLGTPYDDRYADVRRRRRATRLAYDAYTRFAVTIENDESFGGWRR